MFARITATTSFVLATAMTIAGCELDDSLQATARDEQLHQAVSAALQSAGVPAVFDDEVPLPTPATIELANGTRLSAYGFEAVWEEAATGTGHALTALFGWSGFSAQELTFERELWVKVIVGASPAPFAVGSTIEWVPVVDGPGPSLDASFADYTQPGWRALMAASFTLNAVQVGGDSVGCGAATDSTMVDCTAWLGTMSGVFSMRAGSGGTALDQPPLTFEVPIVRVRYRY